jgi:C4-dicarboxylate transporter DctM subunit
LLIVGCFIDNISSCLILAPIFLPIVVSYGISPVHFGLVMTLALAIGFVTPPYGANLFVATAISGVPFNKVARSAVPLVLAMIAVLLAVTYIEPLSMTLVRMVAK